MDLAEGVSWRVLGFVAENALLMFASLIIFAWTVYQWLKRPKNFPPGPIGLPVLGVAHRLRGRAEIALTKMANKYGPIVGVKLLRNFTVVLNSIEAIEQAFVKQGNAYSGRPESGMFRIYTEGKGVLAIDGIRWKENRKFGTAVLRKLGVGKATMEESIVEEMICMCSALQVIKGKAFDSTNLVTHSVANIICALTFGERFPYDDLQFISTARSMVDWFNDYSDSFMFLTMAPFLQHFPPFRGQVKSLMKAKAKLYTLLLPIVKRHKDTFDGYDYSDFVEAYLMEIEKNKGNPSSLFTDDDLQGYVRDLFVAGTDTTVTAIRWTIIFLINRPHVQRKIQKEIDSVIGPDARPKMAHMDQMHYTKAVMHEMLRVRTPGPLGLAHKTLEPTKLMGYDIPKGTQVLANIYAVHMDPAIWAEPEEFRPERFLDADKKFNKQTKLIPFSMGTRYCMGESIARMEYFFFLVVTLQRYHLEPPSQDELLTEECHRSGQFMIAPRFKMKVKERFCRAKSIKEYQDQMLTEE